MISYWISYCYQRKYGNKLNIAHILTVPEVRSNYPRDYALQGKVPWGSLVALDSSNLLA